MNGSSYGRNVAFLPADPVLVALALRYRRALDQARAEPSIEHEDALEDALSDFVSMYAPGARGKIMETFYQESRQRLGIAK